MRKLPASVPGALGASLLPVLAALLAACQVPAACAVAMPEPSQPMVEYVTQQETLTPLPLRVRLPARYGAERVLVFYQTWGARRWDTLELARAGQTWSGEVSCRDVSTITGDTRYYFLAVDRENRAVVDSNWLEWPHVATVVSKLADGPQALPGMAPPDRCHDPADCPPDFLGCPAYALRRPVCHEDADCRGGGRCDWDGYCSDASQVTESGGDDAQLKAAVAVALQKGKRDARAQYSSWR